jgi:hypothetical protein
LSVVPAVHTSKSAHNTLIGYGAQYVLATSVAVAQIVQAILKSSISNHNIEYFRLEASILAIVSHTIVIVVLGAE